MVVVKSCGFVDLIVAIYCVVLLCYEKFEVIFRFVGGGGGVAVKWLLIIPPVHVPLC